ncbi:DUF5305 family protein [Halocatena marina]|nr:DUF5305 family protein [Halocatena marina]
MTSHRRTRLAVLINNHFLTIVLALAIITAGGGWLTYTTVISPGTHAEQQTVSAWQADGTFNYSATAVNDTPIFDKGDVRTNRMFYITNTTPVLDGAFNFQLDGDSGNATVVTRVRLVNYALYKNQGESDKSQKIERGNESKKMEKRIWSYSTPLTTNRQQVAVGNKTKTQFTVNASSVRTLHKQLLRRHGSLYRVADLRTSVAVSTQVNGTVNGDRVERNFNYTLPINSTMDYYSISSPKKPEQQVTVTRRVMVQSQPETPAILGSLASLLAPLAGLAMLFYGRENNWFDVTQTAHTEAERAKVRSEFNEWVTVGTVDLDDDRPTITVESLEGLVDVAIDSNRRVIEDAETGVYVVRDDVWYQFTPEWTTTDENEIENGNLSRNGEQIESDQHQKQT